MSDDTHVAMPVAVRWKCPDCKTARTQTIIEKGHVFVPYCATCISRKRGRPRCAEGMLLTEVDGALTTVGPELAEPTHADTVKLASQIQASDLWDMFVRLLDTGRVQMGDGTPGNGMCRSCEPRAHFDTTSPCSCVCHEAWAFKQRLEAKLAEQAA